MDAVKACSLDPATFARRFHEAATTRGFRPEPFAEIGDVALSAYTKRSAGVRPRIYLSSGIHGDEPAAPLALLAMLESGLFDERATWFLCPLLNPTGFVLRTRENAGGVDLNRDYLDPCTREVAGHVNWLRRQPSFDAVMCMHEDWEAQGFYLYELNSSPLPSLADAMIAAASEHMPIETSAIIDGREAAAPGIIRPVSDPLLRETWPEAVYLHARHCQLNYTLETPSTAPGDRRIATHSAAVQAGLARFFKDWTLRPRAQLRPAFPRTPSSDHPPAR
jgi:murein peptide amidase A